MHKTKVAIGLFAILVSATHAVPWPAASSGPAATLASLGQELVKTLVLMTQAVVTSSINLFLCQTSNPVQRAL